MAGRGFWRSGGPLDTMFGGSVVLMVAAAAVVLVAKWPLQCLAAVGGGAALLTVAAAVSWREGRADARRRDRLAARRAVPRPAGPPPVEQLGPAAAAAAMRAAGFPESVVASWLAEPGTGGVDEQAPASG